MKIERLGELSRDPDIEEWLVSEPVEIPFLGGTKLAITLESIEDDLKPEEFVEAVDNFLAMTDADCVAATPYVFKLHFLTNALG